MDRQCFHAALQTAGRQRETGTLLTMLPPKTRPKYPNDFRPMCPIRAVLCPGQCSDEQSRARLASQVANPHLGIPTGAPGG